MVRARPVRLDKGDAADWVEARLAEPQADGVTRVLMHSVVWQYLPETTADRIRAAMHAAGARATPKSEEHTSELQSLMRTSYAVFCLKKKQQIDGYIYCR